MPALALRWPHDIRPAATLPSLEAAWSPPALISPVSSLNVLSPQYLAHRKSFVTGFSIHAFILRAIEFVPSIGGHPFPHPHTGEAPWSLQLLSVPFLHPQCLEQSLSIRTLS